MKIVAGLPMTVRPNSGDLFRPSRLAIGLAIGVVSCLEPPTEPEPFDFNSLLNPINGVVIYAGSHYEYAEVDDTIRVYAAGFHNGNGIGTQALKTVEWSVSDATALQVTRTESQGNLSQATLRGLKPGLVTLSAKLNGVAGTDTIRVVPRIKQLQIVTTRATLGIGDTVEIWLRADDMNGDSIPHVRPLYLTGGFYPYPYPLRYVGPWPRQRYVGKDTGTVEFLAGVANDTTPVLKIRVLPPAGVP